MSYEFPRQPPSGPVICFRGACKAKVEPLDAWFNIGNGMWYCAECAKLINELNFSGKLLCFIPPYAPEPPKSVRVKYLGASDDVGTCLKPGEFVSATPNSMSFRDRASGGLHAVNDNGDSDLVWAEEVEGDISSLFPTDVPEELRQLHGIDLSTDVGRWRAALYIVKVHGRIGDSNIWYGIFQMALTGQPMKACMISALREILLTPPRK